MQQFPKFCLPNVTRLWVQRVFFQVIYLSLGLILLGRWRLWIIGTWHPLILSTMCLCVSWRAHSSSGVLSYGTRHSWGALCLPPMPVGFQCPSDSMWMLRLWKWGSLDPLPFVVPCFGIWSVLHPVFLCVCLPLILARLCFPLLPFIQDGKFLFVLLHMVWFPAETLRVLESFPAISPDVPGDIAIPHLSEEWLEEKSFLNYLCPILGQSCPGLGCAPWRKTLHFS